ncbi:MULTISPECIES: phosphonate ABC transporter, permease protein PhnE [unclassified Roseovarius]|jgi:phosphonate transport system permease protein|uniref:phosphonate ABC transporter, permease protein PhnE n=1 Tax=unclassified Roseovarius TaxID=2614913 RepID=UPI000068485A|nr:MULTISPECIES: phosphonate ABC transporter, permease protein PhnE [unclassified Roseovarius]EAQ25856.1 ABC phosphonate permease [Roseovarius sp. 217]KJS40946.1 MAG: phosphonate ABC transporter permease [Roseovarius sp. BRH_c41]
MVDQRLQAPDRFRRFSAVNFVLLVALGAIILVSMGQVAPSPQQLAQGLPGMANLIGRMLPPNLEPDFLARVALRMIETFQIALVGAVLGIVVSLPIAWCAARGVSPLGRGNILVKAFISFLRTVPDLVWALLFVASIGLGAVAGTMTIMVDTIGFCGRFFAEAMEDAEKEPQEALAAIGANRPSILIGAILPDILPSLINSSLFALEKAVRSSVVLGLVGAGGIGQELKVAFDLFQYRNASMIILAIFAIVLLMEICTDKLRARLT